MSESDKAEPMGQKNPNKAEIETYAREYVANGGNQSGAWRATFPKSKSKPETVWRNANLFHKFPEVRKRIAEVEAETAAEVKEKYGARVEDVISLWWKIATADVRELSRVERIACRYCHGLDHEYQWVDEKEFQRSHDEDADDWGGYGYTTKLRPVEGCPRCHGEGLERVTLADSRDLSAEAALLYDGVELTRNGVKVKSLSRMDAMANLVRAMGGFTDNMNHRSPDGSMTPTVIERHIVDPKA